MSYRSRSFIVGGNPTVSNGIGVKGNAVMEQIMATAQANAESNRTRKEIDDRIKKIDIEIKKLELSYGPVLARGSNQPKQTLTDAINQRKQADMLRAQRSQLIKNKTSIAFSVQQRETINMAIKMKNVHSKNINAAETLLKILYDEDLMTLRATSESTQEIIDNSLNNINTMTKDIDNSIIRSTLATDEDEDDEYTMTIKEELKKTDKNLTKISNEADYIYDDQQVESDESDDFMERILKNARMIAGSDNQ
jgi:hypothetical protein